MEGYLWKPPLQIGVHFATKYSMGIQK